MKTELLFIFIDEIFSCNACLTGHCKMMSYWLFLTPSYTDALCLEHNEPLKWYWLRKPSSLQCILFPTHWEGGIWQTSLDFTSQKLWKLAFLQLMGRCKSVPSGQSVSLKVHSGTYILGNTWAKNVRHASRKGVKCKSHKYWYWDDTMYQIWWDNILKNIKFTSLCVYKNYNTFSYKYL